MKYSLAWFFNQKDTNKGRKQIAKVLGHKLKLCRTGSNFNDDGKAVKPNSRSKSHLSAIGFQLINSIAPKYRHKTKGYGKEYPTHGTKSRMLGKHINKFIKDDHVVLKNAMGYYPHVFYKKQWRPIFFECDYYDKEEMQDIKFWCYTDIKGRPKKWSVKGYYNNLIADLTGQPVEPLKAVKEKVAPPSDNSIMETPERLRQSLAMHQKELKVIKNRRWSVGQKMYIKIKKDIIKRIKIKLKEIKV